MDMGDLADVVAAAPSTPAGSPSPVNGGGSRDLSPAQRGRVRPKAGRGARAARRRTFTCPLHPFTISPSPHERGRITGIVHARSDASNRRAPCRQPLWGPLAGVSRLTLGGGGLGRIWGETSIDEAVATVHAAVEAGINLIDTAPMYRDCEEVIGKAFEGRPPDGVRITTKHQLGAPPAGDIALRLEESLDASLTAMRPDHADIFFLHSNICPAGYIYARFDHRQARFATPWSLFVGEVIPAMQALRARGRIGAWGITGVGVPRSILAALAHDPAPDVVQAVSNLLDSAGGMRNYDEAARPREIIAAAKAHGVGVMGIRAVQAGALTAALDRDLPPDHPEAIDFARAAPFRALCARMGADPALIAHRYALAMDGVDTVVLGVKYRAELAGCLEAEAEGPLPPDVVAEIDALGLRSLDEG